MRAWWMLVVVGCSSQQGSQGPHATAAGSQLVPPTAGSASTGVAAPTPPTMAPPTPAPPSTAPVVEDHVAKLPKQDFMPPLRLGAPADKQKKAAALNIEGLALYKKKDLAGAEAKYAEALQHDPGHAFARYNLASTYVLTNRADKGLALLAELSRAKDCVPCQKPLGMVGTDDDWQSQWGTIVLWQILALEANVDVGAPPPPPEGEPEPWERPVAKVSCPAGSTQRKVKDEAYCMRNGVMHGPYISVVHGWHGDEFDVTRGLYKNGKRHGEWSLSGTFHSYRGSFVDGVPHGLWSHSDKGQYGYHEKRSAFVHGKRHNFDQTFVHDTLIEETFYVNDAAHGSYRKWNPGLDDTPAYLEEEGRYEHGTPVGRWVTYDGPNRIAVTKTYDAGTVHGEVVTFVEGKKRKVENFDHGVRHGVFEYWHDGKLVASTKLDHDTGDWIEYVESKLVAKGKLVKGVRDGAWALVEDRHTGWAEGSFAAGKRTGPWTNYDDAAKQVKIAEGAYVDDQRHGAWTFWRDDGTKLGKGSYAKGKPDGAWIIYDESGTDVVQELVLKNDTLVKIDGQRATADEQRGYRAVSFVTSPSLVEPMASNPVWP